MFDPRLQNIAPPYFLTPALSAFKVASYATVTQGFDAGGVNQP